MLEIVKHPDPILSQPSLEVKDFAIVKSLVDQMIETMHALEGVGLAAPQVGVLKRLVVIDQSVGTDANMLKVMINPTLTYLSPEKELKKEGCLSLPDVNINVLRSTMICVQYSDLENVKHTSILSGLEARIVQHEIEHLNGVTLLNKISDR